MNLTRRHFLTLAGSGIAVAALPTIIEPVRRFWQVSRNAPVGESKLYAIMERKTRAEARAMFAASGDETVPVYHLYRAGELDTLLVSPQTYMELRDEAAALGMSMPDYVQPTIDLDTFAMWVPSQQERACHDRGVTFADIEKALARG